MERKRFKATFKGVKISSICFKNWREKEKIEYQESKKVLIDSNWRPSEDAISILKSLDINDSFFESLLPEFILFWKEKRIKSNSWNSTFLNHVKKQWAKKSFKLDSGKENHPMSKNWRPSEDCMKVLEVTNIPVDFIESKLPEFRLYWIDAGEISTNWNNKFINFVKNSWEKDSKKVPIYWKGLLTLNGQKIKIPCNHIELVNLIFAQLEITYHNQFHKAFKDEVSLNLAKQLWLKKLEIFSLDLIFEAIDELTSKSKFLPSLSQTLEEIKNHYLKKEGIKSIESAFAEACLGSDDPENFKWSHPLVYETAKNFGWADLRRSEEKIGFEKFQSLMSDSIKDYLSDASNFYLPELNVTEERKTNLSQQEQIQLLDKLKRKHSY